MISEEEEVQENPVIEEVAKEAILEDLPIVYPPILETTVEESPVAEVEAITEEEEVQENPVIEEVAEKHREVRLDKENSSTIKEEIQETLPPVIEEIPLESPVAEKQPIQTASRIPEEKEQPKETAPPVAPKPLSDRPIEQAAAVTEPAPKKVKKPLVTVIKVPEKPTPAAKATTERPLATKATEPTVHVIKPAPQPVQAVKAEGRQTKEDSIVIRPHTPKKYVNQETIMIRPRTDTKTGPTPKLVQDEMLSSPIKIGKEVPLERPKK